MKLLHSLLFILTTFNAFAQKSDSTHTHFRIIRGGLIEHSTELKSIKNVKNGISEIKSGKALLAMGMYKDGNRVGRWRFYKNADSVEQVYNYTTKKLEYNSTINNILYEIDSLKVGDTVVYPAKIGGFYTSLYFLRNKFQPSRDFRAYPGEHSVFLVFYLDENGKLTKYETETGGGNLKKLDIIDLKKMLPVDFEFVPAYVNGKPVASRLIYSGKLTVN
ncbi:energy transducer TonB [Pedobacter mucosus]|uniref:energy transducer TonB n=1 Tax=Pedobacter mucosus TaxID=2895286 RepID=UPI001EE42209|nr:hypothetical protein [Pedobacter mucosus]UKT62282.1 hypothetical protein LOK61_10960 [Pedobacter mucosus]